MDFPIKCIPVSVIKGFSFVISAAFKWCIFFFQSNIGLILHGQREFKIAVKFLEKALNVQLK